MRRIVVLSNDGRTAVRISQWSKDFLDETTVESFNDIEKFKTKIAAAPAPVIVDPKAKGPKKVDLSIQVVIVDQELFGDKSCKEPIEQLAEALKKTALSDPEFPVRFVVLAFEGAFPRFDVLISPLIVDVLLKPLDQDLYMQKLDMAASNVKSTSSSYLYRHATSGILNMAKTGVIEEVSEVGVGIRNPTPLKPGVFAKLYSPLFGGGSSSGIYGRVYRSVEHPLRPGEFVSYFGYYGMSELQGQKVRQFLQAKRPALVIPSPDDDDQDDGPPELDVKQLRAMAQGSRKFVVIVDFDPTAVSDIRQILETKFFNAHVHNFVSYSGLQKVLEMRLPPPAPKVDTSYASPGSTGHGTGASGHGSHGSSHGASSHSASSSASGAASANSTPTPAIPKVFLPTKTPAFTNGLTVAVKVSREGFLKEVEPPFSSKDKFLGWTLADLKSQSERWKDAVHPDDMPEVDDFIAYLAEGGKAELCIRLIQRDNTQCFVRLLGQKTDASSSNEPIVRLEFTELKYEEGARLWKDRHPFEELNLLLNDLQTIFIDTSFLRPSPKEWLETFHDLLKRANVLGPGKSVELVLMQPPNSRLKIEDLRFPIVTDVIAKPLDRRYLQDKLPVFVPGLCNDKGVVTPKYLRHLTEVFLGKEVSMTMISEYGLEISSSVPLRDGIFMRFFSPIFLDEKGEGVLARSYVSVQDQNNKNVYKCFFTFFGVSDGFLKHIRQWIRETYIQQKGEN